MQRTALFAVAVMIGCSDPVKVHIIDAGPDAVYEGPCTLATDCGDLDLRACDPSTRTCVATDCGVTEACAAGSTCVRQTKDWGRGLCRPSCTIAGDAGCGPGESCVFEPGLGIGACLAKGEAPLGGACVESNVSTGCADGVCRQGTCVAFCDPFAISSPCPGTTFCSASYDCSQDVASADTAAVEHFCTKDAGTACGIDAGRETGTCVSIYSVNICRPGCRMDVPADCPASTICAQPPPLPKGALGVCMPALDQSACVDGGTGTCAACRTAETGSGGCCEAEAAACTTQACLDFVDCAIACKRVRTCVDACIVTDPAAATLGTPELLCLAGYGAPPGGACGDVCGGLAVCGTYDGPDTASTCTSCPPTTSGCRANGCFNGYYCERVGQMCVAPTSVPDCTN